MATIPATLTIISSVVAQFKWAGMVAGDVGAAVQVSANTWRTLETFGGITGAANARMALEVSNDGGTTWTEIDAMDGNLTIINPADRSERWRVHPLNVTGGPYDVILTASKPV